MKKQSLASEFDDDFLFNVLLQFPVDVLHKTMQSVSRQWRKIIKNPVFIRQHMLNSNHVLLKQINHDHAFSRCNFEVQNDQSEDVVIKVEKHLQFPGRVFSSVDGLLMFSDRYNCKVRYVENPVTKERFTLPSCPTILNTRGCTGDEMSSFDTRSQVNIVAVVSAVEYKLVWCYYSLDSRAMQVYTISIGNCKHDEFWRRIDHRYPNDIGRKIPEQFSGSPIPIEGFLVWAKHDCGNMISLDMKTEKFVEFPAPVVDASEHCVHYLKMKNKLSCIHKQARIWTVYLLEESERTSIYQWRKLYEIDWDLGCFLVPLAWNENGEVLVLTNQPNQPNSEVVAINFVSKSSSWFSFSGINTSVFAWQLPHVDSLVSVSSIDNV